MTHTTAPPPALPPPGAARERPHAPSPAGFLHGMTTRQFVVTGLRQLVPGLVLSIACTLILYSLLRPHFPPASVIPLLGASLCPVLANIVSLARHRRPDLFGVMVLIGLAASIVGVALGGGPRLLLLRESFVTGASGVVMLASLALPRPLGYYFARQLLTANDPAQGAAFAALWQDRRFRRAMRGGTVFWGCLLLGEFAVRVALVLTLPVVLVLALAPLVLNALIFGGVVVSASWAARLLRPGAATPPA